MNPIYEPSNLAHAILALVFYVVSAGFVIYSLLALYALNRYGRSKSLVATISVLYILIAAGLYSSAVTNLNNIRF